MNDLVFYGAVVIGMMFMLIDLRSKNENF